MKPIHKKTRLKSLKVQITLYFLITSLVIITLIGTIFYYSTSRIVLADKLDSTIASVEQSGQYIEVYVEKLKVLATIVSNNTDTRGYLAEGEREARHRLLSLINETLKSDASLVSIIIVGKNGEIVSNEDSLDMSVSEDMMKEEWYVKAINSGQMPVLTSARQQQFSMDKDTWVISISQEIVDTNGLNLGVIVMDIKYEILERYLQNINLGETGFAFIMNDTMGVVYHPDVHYFEDNDKKNHLLSFLNMEPGYDQNMGVLTHLYSIHNTNWTLVGVSSLDDLDIIRRQILEMVVFACILLFLIAIGGGFFIASRITDPIKNLQNAMVDFEVEMNKIEIDTKSCNEVRDLSLQFNRMMDQIKSLMVQVKENESYLRSYEINALHSQINPHFLYNTLDTIVWMAEFKEHDKVIAVTKSLAEFFRLSLSKGKEKISLLDEFEHVKMYLFIQEQRYAEKLNYELFLDDSIKHVEVPKIILQPIVENAIYHGIREKENPGHLSVRAQKQDDHITITIKDDGVGFDISAPKKQGVKLGGVGIDNVDQRLRLYYGTFFGLKVESEIGKGTTVVMRIPLK